MNAIDRDELKEKLDRGDDIVLVMVLGDWAFRASHIPGSVNYSSPEEAMQVLDKNAEIVVYCSGGTCPASKYAYDMLVYNGFVNVRRYAGGLADWQAAGYPLEGDMTTP